GVFPASFFALPTISKIKKVENNSFIFINFILLFSVLTVFGVVKTKILHYSSLAYLPLTFLAAVYVNDIMFKLKSISKANKIAVLVYGVIISLALIVFPIFMYNINNYLDLIKDNFTRSILQSQVYWSGLEIIPGIFLLLGLIFWFFLINREYELKGFYILFTSVATSVFMFMYFLAPQIEQYTQASPIEFYQKYSSEKVIIAPLGFKSYAHYFYGNVTPYNLKLLYSKNGFSFFEK
ncbi:hypothetical protein EB169_05560, partial [archaeon]|nr:hypothetical protein [archaeon]